jgi:PucR family transcriptional regulator, purine catabolism regulatory protein
MELTVNGLIKNELLKNSQVIAGNKGLYKKIMGITIMEAPDIAEWLKGGEFILTSLYTLNTLDENVQGNILQKLNEKNISAIGFKRRKKDELIPQILIDLGNKYNIPIILIPTEVPFLDIMNPVMAEIFNRQMIQLKHYKEVHDKFTALALENRDLETIVNTLSDLVRNPVVIYDKKFNCIYSSNMDIITFDILEETYHMSVETSKELKCSNQRVRYNKLNNLETNQIVVSIKTINNIQIYLVVSEVDRSLEELDYITIENAVTVICLEMVKQFSISEVEKKLESDLIDDLLQGNLRKSGELLQRASILGLDISHKYVVCSMKVTSKSDALKLGYKYNDMKIQHIIYEAINEYIDKCFIRTRNDNITLLIDVEQYMDSIEDIRCKIKIKMSNIQEYIRNSNKNIKVALGISNIIDSIYNVDNAYKESRKALDIGMSMYDKECITTFEELGILRLLYEIENKVDLMNFVPNEIKKLIEYDKKNNSDLLNTLYVFLSNGTNASQTAKAMYMHYKTIMYRLEKIRIITGIEFNDSEKLLEIQVGLKILNII